MPTARKSISPRITARWSKEELQQWHRLYTLRSHFDGLAARFAAEAVADGACSQALRGCYERMRHAAREKNYPAFLEADMFFHREIASLARTEILPELWQQLESTLRPFVSWVHRELFGDLETIANTHAPFFEAIAAGDARAAERLAQIDLDSLWQMLTSMPAEPETEADPVERLCAYVILNLHRRLVFATLAREVCNLSRSHLAKLFVDRRGESFQAYVQNLRMRRASDLLRTTNLSIGDIAMRVGYTDASRFGVHFRRRYGETPVTWRANNAGARETVAEANSNKSNFA